MELEEAIQIIKEDLEHTKKANECWINVTEETYNQLQIGDYYEESE